MSESKIRPGLSSPFITQPTGTCHIHPVDIKQPAHSTGPDYIAACRTPDARNALVYFPPGKPASIRTFLLKGPRPRAQWFGPRTGAFQDLPPVEVAPRTSSLFQPTAAGKDWALVLKKLP